MDSLSTVEVAMLERYRARRGSFNVGLRVEQNISLLTHYFLSVNGVKSKYQDLAPHDGPGIPPTPEELYEQQVARLMGGK